MQEIIIDKVGKGLIETMKRRKPEGLNQASLLNCMPQFGTLKAENREDDNCWSLIIRP